MLSQDATLLSLIERPVSCGTETAWKYVETDARSSAMGPRGIYSNAAVPPASAIGGVPFPIEAFFVGRHGGL